jgi:Mce-associated membrane protein
MAADADAPNRKLSANAAIQMSPPSLRPPDDGAVKSALDAEKSMTTARLEAAETENDFATADDDMAQGFKDAVLVDTSHMRRALVSGTIVALVLTALVGWLGLAAYQSHRAQQQRELFIQAGRQGALNLTTIDWQHADSDVQRILDSATGTFYDEFSKRRQPFIEVVKKSQSKSVGTITEAGLESESGDEAQLMVAVSVKTANLGAAEQPPGAWRIRISVMKVGNEVKISNVRFVS